MSEDKLTQIKKLVKEEAGIDAKEVKYLGEGWDSEAYDIGDNLVAKIPKKKKERKTLIKEALLMKYLHCKDVVLVPEVRFSSLSGSLIIMEKINGIELEGIWNSIDKVGVMKDIANVLQDIFEFKLDKEISTVLPKDGVLVERFRDFKFDILKKYLLPKDILFVKGLIESFDDGCKVEISLCHNDISLDRIYVDPVSLEIVGIIDWADAALSDLAYEYGRLLRESFDWEVIQSTLKLQGYDLKFEERVKEYAILSSAEDIVDGHVIENFEYSRNFANKVHKLIKLLK